MRQKLEETASEFLDQVAQPVAEKIRAETDDLMDRLSNNAHDVRTKVGDQLAEMPAAALARLDLVPAKVAKRRFFWGLFAGLSIGAAILYFRKQRSEASSTDAHLPR